MNGFFASFVPIKSNLTPLFKRLKKYKIEIFLLTTAFVTALISAYIFLTGQKQINDKEMVIFDEKTSFSPHQKIVVDISGAVEKPDIYEVTLGARLKDVLIMAGGLSANAHRQFFSRHFNLAKILSDQEKIYIPSVEEIQSGTFTENQQTLNYMSKTNDGKININTASPEELDRLPGVGKVTAQKIIQGRPYQNLQDLLTKKVVTKSVYEKIRDLIEL